MELILQDLSLKTIKLKAAIPKKHQKNLAAFQFLTLPPSTVFMKYSGYVVVFISFYLFGIAVAT